MNKQNKDLEVKKILDSDLKKFINSNKYLLYVGNAYPHKNLSRLISAVLILNQNRDEKIKLLIISSRNVFTERLAIEIKKQNATGYVYLTGYVSEETKNILYKKSVAFVFPSLEEGFGLPPLEAIKNEALCVVSDIKPLKEVYQNSVYYFNPLNVRDISLTIANVINLPESIKKKKIKESQEFIKKYSWEKMARETLLVYKDLLKD